MIPQKVFADVLRLGVGWEVQSGTFESSPVEHFRITVRAQNDLWRALRCPDARCEGSRVVSDGCDAPKSWRHLDALGKRSEIHCALPRARCEKCGVVWTVPAPWEGSNPKYTKQFEVYSQDLLGSMPRERVEEILGEREIAVA